MTRAPEHHRLAWRGRVIAIDYEADWLGFARTHRVCHFDIRTVEPDRAPIPITETGYRSHFDDPDRIVAAGGPVAFVLAWLDHAARDPDWKEHEAASRQLPLF
jgi:hypothetical protein